MNPKFLLYFLFFLSLCTSAQQVKIHSHNDYEQDVPFWHAFSNGLSSIEADIFLKDDVLYVTHDEEDIQWVRTLENLYLDPIRNAIRLNLFTTQDLQLLIDIKSKAEPTLDKLLAILEKYPELTSRQNLRFVISGNRPSLADYPKYPDFISFDYQSLEPIRNPEALNKVDLISLNFRAFSRWNGKGRLTQEDYEKVHNVVDAAHALGKPFRFWATPDSKSAWKAFADMGVDFINTDLPGPAATYLKTLKSRVFKNTLSSSIYTPSFKADQQPLPVKNVILLIGDGNGLAQISAATLANGGNLSLTQLKSIGLLKTQSADDFTTDSAAAATAIATGQKTNNRAIGTDSLGQVLPNMVEILGQSGFATGLITTDQITGATPASFYAHRTDRSDISGILQDLQKTELTLLIGGGGAVAEDLLVPNTGIEILSSSEALGKSKANRAGYFFSASEVPAILDGRGNQLAQATKNALEFLSAKALPFFLMIEGAQIDSYGHENKVGGIVTEGIDFDRAIAEALKFADKSGNTLVIITADHETSGFSIPQGNMESGIIEGDFTTDDHTGIMVPIFSYGPQSNRFQGVYENTAVFKKILQALQIDLK